MPILTRRRQLAGKIEAVEGTAEVLAAADVSTLIISPSFKPEISMFKRDIIFDSLSKYRQIPGTQSGRIAFRTELKGSGTAGTAPSMGKYLKACGFGETVAAGVSVTYAPLSAGFPSLTIAMNSGDDSASGVRRLIRGARGSVKFSGKLGEPMMADFEFLGVFVPPTDLAPIAAITYDNATEPQPLLAATFTTQGYAGKIENIAFDMGNQLALRTDVNTAEGFFSCMITDRDPQGAFDPEDTLIATQDWWGKLKGGVEGAVGLSLGLVPGNIVTFAAPKVQYINVQEGERTKLAALSVDFSMNKNAQGGNDEFTIAFT